MQIQMSPEFKELVREQKIRAVKELQAETKNTTSRTVLHALDDRIQVLYKEIDELH